MQFDDCVYTFCSLISEIIALIWGTAVSSFFPLKKCLSILIKVH